MQALAGKQYYLLVHKNKKIQSTPWLGNENYGNLWKSLKSCGNLWKSLEIYGNM